MIGPQRSANSSYPRSTSREVVRRERVEHVPHRRAREAVDDRDAERRRRPGGVLHPLRGALPDALGVAVAPHLGRQDPLVARVDRVRHSLADEVGADRPAAEAVALEQCPALLDVPRIGDRPVDLEVIAPAGELDAVEAPRTEIGGEIGEGQVGPLAGEEGDGSGHLSSLRTGVDARDACTGSQLGRGENRSADRLGDESHHDPTIERHTMTTTDTPPQERRRLRRPQPRQGDHRPALRRGLGRGRCRALRVDAGRRHRGGRARASRRRDRPGERAVGARRGGRGARRRRSRRQRRLGLRRRPQRAVRRRADRGGRARRVRVVGRRAGTLRVHVPLGLRRVSRRAGSSGDGRSR